MKPIQDIPQHKKSIQYQKLSDYRQIIEQIDSDNQLVLFDDAIHDKVCINIFKPCFKKLNGQQKLFCSPTCNAQFHREIQKLNKKRKQTKRNDEYKKELNAWITENPTAYNAMLKWCKNDYKLGIVRISTKWLIEQARRRMKIKWNNSWTSLLARRLIEDAKEIYDIDLTDVIELRKRILEE